MSLLLLGAGPYIDAAAGGGSPVITLHGTEHNTTGTGAVITTTGVIPAGALCVYLGHTTENRSLSSVTDNSGAGTDVWTRAAAYAPNASQQIIAAWKIATVEMAAGTLVSGTTSGSGSKQAVLYAVTNMDVAQSVVQGTGAFGTSTAPAASITPANASDIVFSIVGINTGAADTFTHDATFSSIQNRLGATHAAYAAARAPGSTSLLTKTDSNSVSRTWVARLFAFKAA